MKKILIALIVTVVILYLPVMFINNPAFQQWFLQTYRPFSPWKMGLEKLVFRPIPPLLAIQKLDMQHPGGHYVQFEKIKLRFKFWRLLRGQLSLDPLEAETLTVNIPKALKATPKKKRKKLKLRTLLLIQNLLIKESHIRKVALHLPNQKTIKLEEIQVELKPHLLGGTSLKITLNRVEKPKIEKTVFQVVTNFDHWSKNFPYINDVEGTLFLKEALFGRLPIETVDAKLKYRGFHLYSERFAVQIHNRRLLGKLDSRLRKQTFQIQLTTPEPIEIPEIGSHLRTFNVEGALQLDLEMEGKGFKPIHSEGRGELRLSHRFAVEPEIPVDLKAAFDWSKGVVHLAETTISAGEASIEASGSFHLKPPSTGSGRGPSLDIKFTSTDFLLAHFFNKFEDKNLRPIFGRATFEGQVQGLGKNIRLLIAGRALEGGYGPLQAQEAQVDLEMTNEHLKLAGLLSTDGKNTGKADLKIDYGPKRPDQIRPKTIHLEAQFREHPLEALLKDSDLSGLANASLKISGPTKDFKGEGELSAQNGELFGIAFESLQFPLQLTPQQLRIAKVHWVLPNLETDFTHPLIFDFIPGGGLKISGKPIEDLHLELVYHPQNKGWDIRTFRYQEAQLQGRIGPEDLELKGKGSLDLAVLQPLGRIFREISGPCTFALQVKGKIANPVIDGKILLEKNLLSLRGLSLTIEELEGTLDFAGHTLRTEALTGQMGSGSFLFKGELSHENLKPKTWDLALKGNQLYFRNRAGFFRMEYDADVTLKGSRQNAFLKGDLALLDGRYTKDFNIIEEIKEAKKPAKEIQSAIHEGIPIRLDLKVRNLGDLLIDNNVGRIELSANLHFTGTTPLPQIEGSVEIAEGQIHYLGLDFDITRGFMEFRDPYTNPYLEVEAEQEIADAHLTTRLHGRTDNLVMDLSGNSATLGPLEQKDVISLILFGMTTSERHQQSQYQQLELGPELMAEQIAHILQRPIARATGLDIFRLEATPTQEGRSRRFHLGKRITDRLHVEFASDVDREEAVQTFLLEYWLTDFFILKGAREHEEEYQLNVGLRLKSR